MARGRRVHTEEHQRRVLQYERGFILFHELYERNLMANGMDYDTAHDMASKKEKHYRNHPDELHEALAAEGWE
jgi:hypothetical protein